jgi:hypothetical protein
MIVSYALTINSGLHNASKANCAGSDIELRSAACVRGLHSATPNQSALFRTRFATGISSNPRNELCLINHVANAMRYWTDAEDNQASPAGHPPTFGGLKGTWFN